MKKRNLILFIFLLTFTGVKAQGYEPFYQLIIGSEQVVSIENWSEYHLIATLDGEIKLLSIPDKHILNNYHVSFENDKMATMKVSEDGTIAISSFKGMLMLLKINEGEIVPLSSSDFFFKNKNEELRLVDLNSSYVFCGTELGHIYKFTINQGVLNNPRLIFSAEEKVNSDCDTISNYRVTQIEVLNHNSIGVVANYFYEIDFFGQILQRDASILDGYSTKSPFNTFSKDGIDRFFVGTQSYYNDSVNIQFLSNEIRLLEKEVLPQGNYPISLPVQIGFRKWLMPGFYDFSSIVKFDGSNIVREDVLFSPMRGTSCMNNYYYDKETQYIYVLIGDTEGGLKVWRKQVNMEEYINLGQLKGNKYDFVLENVYFGANSSELSDYSFSTLDLLAKELKRNTGVNIKLCGHTSRVPNNDPIERMWLSKRRVMRIKEYLVNNCNVSKKRIEIEGFGDTRLLDDKHPKSEKNRRVSIFLF